ncbi:hypothetical protein F4859DRAFT_97852 [Xylaria cf. heliscus]|nr:hypothetical protein F4859DRAFT_97852 [Xylaria cf. heliscus]
MSSSTMPRTFVDQKEKRPAPLQDCNINNGSPTQYTNIDSAVDMTFPEAVEKDLAKFDDSNNESKMDSHRISGTLADHGINCSATKSGSTTHPGSPDTHRMSVSVVNGMPYRFEQLMEMGAALAQARREKRFPSTITPGYNLQAIIDDHDDLERLNAAREGATDTRDHAFHPEISRLYIEIQRRIQDRDLTHGEVAADSNIRARLSGFANGTGAETGMYNLMRHAVNSVLHLNKITADTERNIVDAVATRVISDIRCTVQGQAARGAHGVEGVNMNGVMDEVFSAIQDTLSQGVGTQANRLDGQINNMSSITDAQNTQVNAIAGHVNAIDNHVHAMGNNVNAMSTLLQSTNGNVTSLTANIGTLQTVVNMIPQMASNAVRDMLRDMIPGIIGPAVEQAFEGAISNELIARLQVFANAVQEARSHVEATNNPRYRSHAKTNRRSWFSIFKKGSSRRSHRTDGTY